jgi:diguanylate cyclase (GGDEF)-like protein
VRGATERARALAALGQRPPRLALRVILYSALTLGIGTATILVYIRHFERTRAEHAATYQASVVTQAIVDRIRPTDLTAPASGDRRSELVRLMRARVLDDGTLAAAIATPSGRIVVATDGDRPRRTLSTEHLGAALGGTVGSELASTRVRGKETRVLRAYAPFRLGDGSLGILVVDKDYGPIAAAARRAAITVAAVLELVLLSLWLCLFPITRSVTRRMRGHLETIAHMALHDDLTGLANRTQLGSELDAALARDDHGSSLAVLFIDLDRFKEVNDTLGHDHGNELLAGVASRLCAAVGPDELVARIGGDEFAILSEHAVDATSAVGLAERVKAALAGLHDVAGVAIEVPASIGIALAPEHGTTRNELLRRADIAMYASKRSGQIEVFRPELDTHSPVRLALTGEFRRALETGQLVVHYQPQVDLVTGAVRGAEALVRWRHPARGLLEPESFLRAAEHAGLLRGLTRYVLAESLQQLRWWRAMGIELDLAVNVSVWDLADARFPEDVARALDEHDIDPSRLELEVTEGVLLSETVRAGRSLERLVERGIRIAIDDFGVGYSSLGQLKSIPVRVLKIDRSFVRGMEEDPSDVAIVRSTIELAHRLGLEVVAEGVESPEHVAQLVASGCDVGQGFHLGRPGPATEFPISGFVPLGEAAEEDAEASAVVPLRRIAV